jgi:rubrerythrin
MELKKYKMEDLFLAALKAETESQKMYRMLARKTDNSLLQNKLLFLADEEEKHRMHIERMFRSETGIKKVRLPTKGPVPYLALEPPQASLTAVKMMGIAIEVEKAATEFYGDFANMFPTGSDESFLLAYFSSMERGHWVLLGNELEFLKKADRPVPAELI